MNLTYRYSGDLFTLQQRLRSVPFISMIATKIASFIRGFLNLGILAGLSLALLVGCGTEKESLFEEDHEVPAHWPSNLSDAADKIDQHLQLLSSQPDDKQYESELRDLVAWTPEVAADSDLTEQQWLPIYDMCEIMRTHLASGDVSPLDIEEDFRKLQSLLIESAQLLSTAAETSPLGNFDEHDEDSSGGGDDFLNASQASEEDDLSAINAELRSGEAP